MDKMIPKLAQAAINYRECIQDLPEDAFLTPINGWSPRDITAHLIGWNRHTITGCRQIRMGNLPSYFEDAPNDYKNINGESVALYFSEDRDLLLAELESSYLSLENFVQFMDPDDWANDFGVRYGEHTVTISSTIEALIQDYDDHRQEIEAWSNNLT
jgi:hypothetical protein